MPRQHAVSITLTDGQVAGVLRDAAGDRTSVLALLSNTTDLPAVKDRLRSLSSDFGHSISASTIRALLILCAFSDDSEREATKLARELELTAATAHRYLTTWVAVGLLQRDPRTRKYSRAAWLAGSAR